VADPFLGILMLDTRFPRIPGDVGNPSSYPFAVRTKTIPNATVERILAGGDEALLGLFLDAARDLERQGAVALTSSCGFLTPLQAPIAASVRVPVFLSSLLQVPLVHTLTGGRVGILTARRESLTGRILTSAGVTAEIPVAVAGLEGSQAFRNAILADGPELDREQIEQDVVALTRALLAGHPDISAFVFECHNLPPYRRAVHAATGKPVFDIVSFARWIYDSIAPPGASEVPSQ